MRALFLSLLMLAGSASATDVYRWVDANGQTHYSDQWQPGAEKVRITTTSPATDVRPSSEQRAATATAGARPAEKADGRRYESLQIVRPAQEEVLWNIEGQLPVSVQVTPALQPGDDLRLFLDGKLQELPAGSTEARLQEVYRGTHTLKAEVANQAGTVLIESPIVGFTVRQTSLLNPSRPANP